MPDMLVDVAGLTHGVCGGERKRRDEHREHRRVSWCIPCARRIDFPIDGIGPDALEIASLVERVTDGGVDEVILALSATMEGDTTNFYIYRRLSQCGDVRVTQLARGVSVGNEIEYTDEITLGRSLLNRTPFSDSFAN